MSGCIMPPESCILHQLGGKQLVTISESAAPWGCHRHHSGQSFLITGKARDDPVFHMGARKVIPCRNCVSVARLPGMMISCHVQMSCSPSAKIPPTLSGPHSQQTVLVSSATLILYTGITMVDNRGNFVSETKEEDDFRHKSRQHGAGQGRGSSLTGKPGPGKPKVSTSGV